MAGVDLPPPCPCPIDEAQEVARLFGYASHHIRLRILHALSLGERSTTVLCSALGEGQGTVSRHIDALKQAALIRRRTVGNRKVCAITVEGIRILRAYEALASDAPRHESSTPLPEPRRPPEAEVPAPSRHLLNAASLLNHAAHPLRLGILLALSEGEKDPEILACEFGDICRSRVGNQLSVLRAGTLVFPHHRGRRNYYALTEAGLSLVQVVRSTCSRLGVRHGGLTLLPEPVTPGDIALDPTSPDGLACLLRSFSSPARLRVLNLLATGGSVCLCHLFDILELPRSRVMDLLDYPKANRLVIEERDGRWPRYRLARPAVDLYWSLVGCFGPRLADVEVFHCDRERLAKLSPCTMPIDRNQVEVTKQLGRKSRTA